MSILEGGGEFICSSHDFRTRSIDEWNNHCFGNPEHYEIGSTVCIQCFEPIEFTNLPFHKLAPDGSKNIQLRCEECESKTVGNVKRTNKKK